MAGPNEKDDEILRAMFTIGVDENQSVDPEVSEAVAAYRKVEALFDMLRRPAESVDESRAGDLTGKKLGEFEILRPLASGGMGRVYLARQESLGRLVALKVCNPEVAREPRMKSRFVTEAHSLARLTHPNIVPVVTTGEDQGYLFLAMEYVAGPNLAQVLQALQCAGSDSLASAVVQKVLASSEGENHTDPSNKGHARLDRAYQTWVLQALKQVAQGLAAAHTAGILHRDIKPSNIVFAANGIPKIVDFGLARTPQTPSTTVAGEFYGTPAYTSPEQARGDVEAVSPASDIFSFGVTLFECLSLDRPFPGRTSADVLSSVLNSDAPLLRRTAKGIPWELEAITDNCLRKNPAARYPSAQPLAEDLQNYLELRPISARPPSRIGRVGRSIRRRPWAAAFLLAFVSAAVLGMFLARNAWADYQAEQARAFARYVDDGDIALFRCLTGQRPTRLPDVIEQYRQEGITAYTAALEHAPRRSGRLSNDRGCMRQRRRHWSMH
jgi:serine/threonine protein kinase